MRVIVCNTIEPFVIGGSERFAERLTQELNNAGHEATLITFPLILRKFMKKNVMEVCTPWHFLDLTGMADVVIPLKFPTWLVKHPNKIVYLNHQLRMAYDLFNRSNLRNKNKQAIEARKYVMEKDEELKKAKKIFAVSRNVQRRLKLCKGLNSELLYHSLPNEGLYHEGDYGNYILSVSRLVPMKRIELLIQAMARTKSRVKCLIVGEGKQRAKLENLIEEYKLADRITLLGWVPDEQLIELYAGALAVYYAPYDEDYGLVTLEAFNSAKPVITAKDSGGVLEFVINKVNGRILPPQPTAFAEVFDQLYYDRELARRMGQVGLESVQHVSWSHCIKTLEKYF